MVLICLTFRQYRVTIQLMTNLLLTSKQKFRFGLAMPDQARPKRNFCLKSTGGSSQAEWSPCTILCRALLSTWQLGVIPVILGESNLHSFPSSSSSSLVEDASSLSVHVHTGVRSSSIARQSTENISSWGCCSITI